MDFLTKRTQFQCVASPAVIFTISASGKVTHKNSTVLTTSAKLSGKGFCPILKAPCQFQQTPWIAFDLTRKAGGENMLNDKSFCNCPLGPIVKVRAAVALGFQSGNFSAQTAATVAALPPLADENKSVRIDNLQAANLQAETSKPQPKNKQEIEKSAAKNSGTKKVSENSNYILKCLTCTKKDCKYRLQNFKDFSDEVIKDTSQKMKKTYEKHDFKTEDYKSYKNAETLKKIFDAGWAYALHHIIPAKQAFAKFPELVKVAHACGYNINCAENLIRLPYRHEDQTGLNKAEKSDLAFEVMAVINMQWHEGPHDYPIDEELARLIQVHMGRRVKIKNYVELVMEDLAQIKIPEDKVICPKKIIAALNKISDKVRAKLAAFKENPKSSYPYYVSREAYFYAFKASRFNRLVALGRGGARLVFRKIVKSDKHKSKN